MALTVERRSMGPDQIVHGGACFGVGPIGHWEPLSQDDINDAVSTALKAGIKDFDTAPWYGTGTGEVRIGRALRSVVPADELSGLRTVTKIGRLIREPDGKTPIGQGYDEPGRPDVNDWVVQNDYTAAGAERSFKESLARMGLDSVWGLRVHDPNDNSTYYAGPKTEDEVATAVGADGACTGLRLLREQGVIKHIGLGMNCNKESHQGTPDGIIRLIRTAAPGTFDSALLAGGWNLLTQVGLPCLQECEKQGIEVSIAGIYASGLLVGGATYAYIPAPQPMIEKANMWRELAKKHGFSLPAVAVAFAMLPKVVTRVVVGMATKAQVEETLAYFKEASDVPTSLWAEAKGLGLLDAEVPLPQ